MSSLCDGMVSQAPIYMGGFAVSVSIFHETCSLFFLFFLEGDILFLYYKDYPENYSELMNHIYIAKNMELGHTIRYFTLSCSEIICCSPQSAICVQKEQFFHPSWL